jgi:hypothetical protein
MMAFIRYLLSGMVAARCNPSPYTDSMASASGMVGIF